jgi:hypothetical protein
LRSLVNRRAARRLEQDHSALALRRRLWALGFILFGTNDLCILLGQKSRALQIGVASSATVMQ